MFITDASDRTIHVSKLRLGTVVARSDGVYGHIVGFSENTSNELLLKFKFCEFFPKVNNLGHKIIKTDPYDIHPANVDIFVDQDKL